MSEARVATGSEQPVFSRDGVVVVADHGCHARLTWRCSLPDLDRVTDVVAQVDGFRITDRSEALVILDHADGRRVVVVPRTGRVQLRLDFRTAYEERVAEARRYGEELAAADALS